MARILRTFGLPIVMAMAGLSFNVLVMAANGGFMPVKGIPASWAHDKWAAMTPQTQIPVFADILPWQYSIGDALIIIGLGCYIILTIIAVIHWRRHERTIS